MVGGLAVTAAALARAAEVAGAVAPSAWRVSAARELAIAPSAWRASAGRISEAARSQAAVSSDVRWRRRASRRRGSRAPAAALAPPRRARSRDREYAPPAWAAVARSATAPSPTWHG